MLVVINIELIAILVLINPVELTKQIQNQQLIAEVAAKTSINTSETPVIALVSDANALRSENTIQAEIYKEAQNGDYVLGFSDKMIIFRRSERRIIYEGDTPSTTLTKNQEALVIDIIGKSKELGIIDVDSKEAPQISVISDAKALRDGNQLFYKDARNDDIIALFPQSGVIILYSDKTKSIINYGNYQTTIK